MKKIKITSILLIFYIGIFAQKVDTTIDKKIYKSYYSFQYKAPLYIIYNLYKGGGDSKRIKFKHESRS